MADSQMEIDDSLYSRQRYMLGDKAMKRMALSSVLLIGCDSLGVEIAKNLVLTGIGNLWIADSHIVSDKDVAGNIYVNQSNLLKRMTRAEACVPNVSELNRYVNVSVSTVDDHIIPAINGNAESQNMLKEVIGKVDCVVATNCTFQCLKYLNKSCRDSTKKVKMVAATIYGLFSSIFCDFGSNFEVYDAKGENLKEAFIANISKGSPGEVTCFDNKTHGLEDGDSVVFEEIRGMEELNGQVREVKVASPYAFFIKDTSNLSQYTGGGIVKQVNVKTFVSNESIDIQLSRPNILVPDLGKLENPLITHVGFIALNRFIDTENRHPKFWDKGDADKVYEFYLEVASNSGFDVPTDEKAKSIVSLLSFTSAGVLPPLAAATGGIAAQEVLKSITGKYTPLQQWLYVDAAELTETLSRKPSQRYSMNISDVACLLGKDVSEFLAKLNIFMVGCGAIGCEMLKNLALLGVSCSGVGGKISITDNDVIEKSNLNRQFLFRNRHVGQSKSSVAAVIVKEMTRDMAIQPMQYKVGPETEQTTFNDAFFESQDIIINALDNIQARKYMDARCVTNQRPLLESGTMGPKGHVQVIVPFITESYGSQQDPADVQYPFCTLKSFPSQIEHTVQWARDKFEVLFTQRPSTFSKFWEGYNKFMDGVNDGVPESLTKYLSSRGSVQDALVTVKLILESPKSWSECVALARNKFEKYFNHKAKNLLRTFPLDTKLEDGSSFWSFPKRPPTPIIFNPNDSLHMQFITSYASLIASVYMIEMPTNEDERANSVVMALKHVVVPEFVPNNKEIIIDENASIPEQSKTDDVGIESLSEKIFDLIRPGEASLFMSSEEFEKDDDTNQHIDFISSVSNLRAQMYGIETVDRLEVKRIAGRIIPAISTTTSAIAGFATIQFLQVAMQLMTNREAGTNWPAPDTRELDKKLSKYRNCFLNLALPLVIFSEPAAAERTAITDAISFTAWDRWEIRGNKDYKLEDFVQHFKSALDVTVSAVLHGSRMIYIPIMPGHTKRLNNLMTKLIKVGGDAEYVDLTITLEHGADIDTDLPCPPIRYYF